MFIEVVGDRGAFGVAYIPVQELGNKSRTDSNSEGDSGTYTAKAELDSHIQVYANLNIADVGGAKAYVVGGIAQATIVTAESLNSGSTYQDEDVMGYTVGLGVRGDLPSNTFYKLEYTYTDYEAYSDKSSAGNTIDAETEVYSLKASVGYQF